MAKEPWRFCPVFSDREKLAEKTMCALARTVILAGVI
jgi:hypothetical protein